MRQSRESVYCALVSSPDVESLAALPTNLNDRWKLLAKQEGRVRCASEFAGCPEALMETGV